MQYRFAVNFGTLSMVDIRLSEPDRIQPCRGEKNTGWILKKIRFFIKFFSPALMYTFVEKIEELNINGRQSAGK